MIYKICSREVWEAAVEVGIFTGVEIDTQDGFIHFSAAHQVKETAAKHFAGQEDLVLVELDDTTLGDDLKWEVSRGGDRFPHLYAAFDPQAAIRVLPLPIDADGVHQFPVLHD